MDTRKVSMEYRMNQWTQMVQARQASGQSVEEYCETTGISKNTYYYWQRKVREAACHELTKRENERETMPGGWARLTVRETASVTEDVVIEVSGCRVIATEETSEALLTKVCRALKAL